MGTLRERRILIVEDEVLIALMLESMLQELGYRVAASVTTVAAGLAAIEKVEGIDAAMLDLNLNGELAHDVGLALADRKIPFVITTGFDTSVLACFEGYPVLQKPFVREQVERVLTKLFGHAVADSSGSGR